MNFTKEQQDLSLDKYNVEEKGFIEGLNEFGRACHDLSRAKGFWNGPENDNVAVKIALLHSELSEMLEAVRAGSPPCGKVVTLEDGSSSLLTIVCPVRGEVREISSVEEEVADVFIRLCDLCGRLKIDLGQVALAKFQYNALRPHMHGKKF